MYNISNICPIVSPVVPTVIYEVKSCVKESQRLMEIRLLEEEQQKVSIGLSKLMVIVHNKEMELKSVCNAPKVSAKAEDCNGEMEVERLITKLITINEKVDKLATDRGIDLSKVSIIDYVEEEQTNLFTLLENLNQRVNDICSVKKINYEEDEKVNNICIHANPQRPPLSLFIMLAHLRKSGFRVACVAYTNSKLINKPPYTISKFINENLGFINFRATYEMIVTIVWTESIPYDCVLYRDIFNNTPIFGEMMCLAVLCSQMKVDINKTMPIMISINDQLHERKNVIAAMTSLNNKLHKEVHVRSDSNVAFGAFVASSLMFSDEKIGSKLKNAIDLLLNYFSFNYEGLF